MDRSTFRNRLFVGAASFATFAFGVSIVLNLPSVTIIKLFYSGSFMDSMSFEYRGTIALVLVMLVLWSLAFAVASLFRLSSVHSSLVASIAIAVLLQGIFALSRYYPPVITASDNDIFAYKLLLALTVGVTSSHYAAKAVVAKASKALA